jgi:hypothetical protein
MTGETVRYNGVPKCSVQKQLDIQRWILDPSSRPYNSPQDARLIARSASTEQTKKKYTVQDMLDLQQKMLGGI